MEKLVVIMDDLPEYAMQLACYLNKKRGFPYRAVVYSRPEEIVSYIENEAVYAVLAAECYEKEVIRLAMKAKIKVYWFSDTKNVPKDSVVYRYQSASEIMRLLMEQEVACKKLKVSGIFCPSGGNFMEGLSERIAKEYAKRDKVLFLPMLPFAVSGREWGDGLSELLFYLRQEGGIKKEVFETLVQKDRNVHSIGPVGWGRDLWGVTKEDIKKLLGFLEEQTEYGHVVIAVGQWDRAGSEVLCCCDEILVPVPSAEFTRGIQTEFMRQLKAAGETEFLSRIVEISLSGTGNREDLLQAAITMVQKGGETVVGAERRNPLSNP